MSALKIIRDLFCCLCLCMLCQGCFLLVERNTADDSSGVADGSNVSSGTTGDDDDVSSGDDQGDGDVVGDDEVNPEETPAPFLVSASIDYDESGENLLAIALYDLDSTNDCTDNVIVGQALGFAKVAASCDGTTCTANASAEEFGMDDTELVAGDNVCVTAWLLFEDYEFSDGYDFYSHSGVIPSEGPAPDYRKIEIIAIKTFDSENSIALDNADLSPQNGWSDVVCSPYRHQFSGGLGTMNSPFIISTANQIKYLGDNSVLMSRPNLVACNFMLDADIDMSALGADLTGTFVPINLAPSFGGAVFDGNGHTISNFTFTDGDATCGGLFGDLGATVRNLTLENFTVSGVQGIAALAGCAHNFTLSNVHLIGTSTITGSSIRIGGLVGNASGLISNLPNLVENSSVSGAITITGEKLVGGIGGTLRGTRVTSSFAEADIVCVGGGMAGWGNCGILVGELASNPYDSDPDQAIVEYSYAIGTVTANFATGNSVGGLLGSFGCEFEGDNCYIRESYAMVDVTTPEDISGIGGLVGDVSDNIDLISDVFAIGDVTASGTGPQQIGGLFGTIGLTSVSNAFFVGNVSAPNHNWGLGGIAGSATNTSFSNVFVIGSIQGNSLGIMNQYDSGVGDPGGSTSIENTYYDTASCTGTGGGPCSNWSMTQQSGAGGYYYNSLNAPFITEWDFSSVWIEVEGDYPALRNTSYID